MSKIKSEIEKICDNFHWRLEELELELRKKIDELNERNLDFSNYISDNRAEWFKLIVHYMTNGLTYRQAIQLIASENHFDHLKLEQILSAFDYQRRATELYAKIYMIRTLKSADFTNKQIAKIMKIHPATVARLLKCNIKM